MFNFEYHKGITKLQLKFLALNLYFVESAAASIEFLYTLLHLVYNAAM